MSVAESSKGDPCVRSPEKPGESKIAFEKVFREVGEVVESVSSRRLVDFFPIVDGMSPVLSDNLGRFGNTGECRCDEV